METVRFGMTGLKVSRLCLGTMAFGRWIDEARSAEILGRALESGINFIDTADVYGRGMDNGIWEQRGESEEILGRLLAGRRHQVVLATKAGNVMGPGANEKGLSRRHLINAVEASLRRLKTDYIDLFQCHLVDPDTPLEETMRTLDDLVRSGKVRYIGCSNFAAWQVAKANGIADRQGLERFVSVQPQYSLLVRSAERELWPFCQSEGVAVMPYSPMARGLLTGKYRPGAELPEGSRAAAGERWLQQLMSEANLKRVEAYRELCASWGLSMAQVATAWVLSNPVVTSVIVGASKPEHLSAALDAQKIRLSTEQAAALEAIFG